MRRTKSNVFLLATILLSLIFFISGTAGMSSASDNEQLVDIIDVTVNGFTVTAILTSEPTSIAEENMNFYLIVLLGNDNGWKAAIIFSYNEGSSLVQYMIGDPFSSPYLWTVSDDYEIIGSNIELTFLEYSLFIEDSQPIVTALALKSLLTITEFELNFNILIIENASVFTPIAVGTITKSPIITKQTILTSISTDTTQIETTEKTSDQQSSIPGYEILTVISSIFAVIIIRRRNINI